MSAFEVYQMYLALNSHFNRRDYDYFKYNKKVRANPSSFEKRKDRYFFEKLSRKYNETAVEGFLLANILKGKKWIGDIANTGGDSYNEWAKRQESLSYHFTEQCRVLLDICQQNEKKPNDLLTVTSGHPVLYKAYLAGHISIDTMVILNQCLGCMPHWNKKMANDVLWEESYLLIHKYHPFVKFDVEKMRKILKEELHEDHQ